MLLLPITEEVIVRGKTNSVEKPIFEPSDLNTLERHFNIHFGGSTTFRYKRYSKQELEDVPKELLPLISETQIGVPHVLASPLLRGSWVDKNGLPVVNNHARYEVYTLRHNNAMEYFKRLRRTLEEHSGEKIIVVEQTEITIVPAVSSDVKRLLRKVEKLKRERSKTS